MLLHAFVRGWGGGEREGERKVVNGNIRGAFAYVWVCVGLRICMYIHIFEKDLNDSSKV